MGNLLKREAYRRTYNIDAIERILKYKFGHDIAGNILSMLRDMHRAEERLKYWPCMHDLRTLSGYQYKFCIPSKARIFIEVRREHEERLRKEYEERAQRERDELFWRELEEYERELEQII